MSDMSHNHQKKIAVINDMSGFGRCSIAVELPVISAMKVQCCPLPTSIFSNHTGFESFFFDDYTDKMEDYMQEWVKLGLQFNGICTGFLGSARQIRIVEHFLSLFQTKDNITIIDPVMGDYGKLYSSYTDEMCQEMKRLLPFADVLTPNLTEACRMLDLDYHNVDMSPESLNDISRALSEQGPGRVVITGLQQGERIFNYVYEKNKNAKFIATRKIGGDRSGTGDVFASIVTGALMQGDDFEKAVRRAIEFLDKAIAFTVRQNLPWNYGICFEEYLTTLK